MTRLSILVLWTAVRGVGNGAHSLKLPFTSPRLACRRFPVAYNASGAARAEPRLARCSTTSCVYVRRDSICSDVRTRRCDFPRGRAVSTKRRPHRGGRRASTATAISPVAARTAVELEENQKSSTIDIAACSRATTPGRGGCEPDPGARYVTWRRRARWVDRNATRRNGVE